MNRIIGVAICVLALHASVLAQGGDAPAKERPIDAIVVEVSGLKSNDGQIGCAIFSKEDGFPDEIEKVVGSEFGGQLVSLLSHAEIIRSYRGGRQDGYPKQ